MWSRGPFNKPQFHSLFAARRCRERPTIGCKIRPESLPHSKPDGDAYVLTYGKGDALQFHRDKLVAEVIRFSLGDKGGYCVSVDCRRFPLAQVRREIHWHRECNNAASNTKKRVADIEVRPPGYDFGNHAIEGTEYRQRIDDQAGFPD